MHPAPSLIVFTTLSGLGFGLIAWLGFGVHGAAPGWVVLSFCGLAFVLASAGLLASLGHLGHPERAWRALSQWRSSWLSREGVLAVATLGVFAVYSALWGFGGERVVWLGLLASALALATVAATAMIYASIRAVPRWRHWSTPALFLALALAGGALLAGRTSVGAGLLLVALVVQVLHWRRGDVAYAEAASDMGTATGLGARGRVRLLEGPHTGASYLTDEMVHRVGRRRSKALRRIAIVLGFVLPAVVFLTLEAWPAKHTVAGLAVLAHVAGVAASRWLFYAEAEHVVGLYYGRAAG
ncbi:MAG TPA: DmsC/YnfH family molybdoenzyme membrane anchor subunit [Paracoccaceae bacterium]|nr:DmsC/YnfH family molybdoenzyme membrane anchor subunit [Paracoccaceae bacterium]